MKKGTTIESNMILKNKPNGLKALMNKATLSLYVMVATRQAKKY